jgi:hypothetical protein
VAPAACMENGVAVTMRLGTPAVAGDSASVEMMTHITRALPPADSLARLTPQQRGVLTRGSRGAMHSRVFLMHKGGEWIAIRILPIMRAG